MRDIRTGFYNPPQAPCIKGEDLLCPIRESPDSEFSCSPSDCRLRKRVEVTKQPENKQEKLV